jgi:hypothetical protein
MVHHLRYSIQDVFQQLCVLIAQLNALHTRIQNVRDIRWKVWFQMQWLQQKNDGLRLLNNQLACIRDIFVEYLCDVSDLIQAKLDVIESKSPTHLGIIHETGKVDIEHIQSDINDLIDDMDMDTWRYKNRLVGFRDVSERGGYRDKSFLVRVGSDMSAMMSSMYLIDCEYKLCVASKKMKSISARITLKYNQAVDKVTRLVCGWRLQRSQSFLTNPPLMI